MTNPKLVLADEPTANLDHETAYKVIKIMNEMKDEFGTTFIFSTHDAKVVGEVEIIYTLEDGQVSDKKVQNTIEVIFTILIVIAISVISSLQPALKASRLEPVEALRHV